MSEPAKTVSAQVALRFSSGSIELEFDAPTAFVPVDSLIPLARALVGNIVELTVSEAEAQGRSISCRAGCGACCRQLVPISEPEARAIHDLIQNLPEPRRSEVLERFARAREGLQEAGLLDALEHPETLDRESRRQLGLDYFRQKIACPFLEEESCSIHPERPIVCREYLVTSPAERCASPRNDIEGLHLPASVWTALARLDPVPEDATSFRWVPLILAPFWVETHREPPTSARGTELIRRLIENVAGASASSESQAPAESPYDSWNWPDE